MRWTNTESGYGVLTIALHWIAAVAILLMLITGFRADMLGDAGDAAGRRAVMFWHISLGASFALILLARVIASWAQRKPTPLEQPRHFIWLARATHQLLLVAILVQIVSGPLAVWSGGRDINVFGAFMLPSPFPAENEAVHEFAEWLHAVGRWAIVALVALHVVAVIKHTFVDKDGVMRRMLAPPAA